MSHLGCPYGDESMADRPNVGEWMINCPDDGGMDVGRSTIKGDEWMMDSGSWMLDVGGPIVDAREPITKGKWGTKYRGRMLDAGEWMNRGG